jgi:hypothetical protein
VKSANFTAANDQRYTDTATLTITDPTGVEGKGYDVLVRAGTSTIGGVAYAVAGSYIRRVYQGGAWVSYEYKNYAQFAASLTAGFTTNKATIVDGDKVAILDSAASDAPKHSLWSLVKSTLKTYFDTLYAATGRGLPTGGSTGDIAKKNSGTNYDVGWETPTSTATANTVVRRDSLGGAEFGEIIAGALFTTSNIGAIYTSGTDANISTSGISAPIYTQGASAVIYTQGANAVIYTQGANANIEAQNSSASVKAWNFAAYDATAGASLRNSAGTAILTWGATAGNISITVNTTSTGHFFSNPSTSEAGHFLTKNGTTPTLAAGRSAWFSSTTGAPQFKNGTGGAVTLLYNGGALGTPSSGTFTNCTGLPISTGVSGLSANMADFLGNGNAANLQNALDGEYTGTGGLVMAYGPVIANINLETAATFNATSYTFGAGAATAFKSGLAIASADISDATSAATASKVVIRDASGGAAFDDLTAATVTSSGVIETTGSISSIRTTGASATIETNGLNANIQTVDSNAAMRSSKFQSYSSTGSSIRNSAGTAIATFGVSGQNFNFQSGTTVTFDTVSFTMDALSKANMKNTLAIEVGDVGGLSTLATTTPGTGVATALAVNVGTAGAFVVNGGALGTPSSGTLTSCTGLPISTGVSGLGTGVATLLTGTPSGTGGPVGTTSPTITTPTMTRSGNGTILTASEGTRSITFGAQSYGTEMVLTASTVGQGAYITANGMLESWVNVIANTNTTNLRVMRFGNKTNRFEIQRLNDASNGILGTPFSFANDAPTNAFYMLTSGTVGFGTSTPSEKSLLDLTSTTKGFLPPRMTTVQRDAITSVPAGLMIYNTTTNKLNFYNGSAWEAVTSA